ncbi:MAG: hypothetical protein ACAH88_12930 [Roseimicrobium sp.]
MSKPKVFRWAIAIPLACLLGIALAFGSWHLRNTDFQAFFQRAADPAGANATAAGGGHSGGSPIQASSATALPSLTQGAIVNQEPQPSREELTAILEQEKRNAANELLTSYILSNEEVAKLNQTPSERPPDHPLVEALINRPNRMRDASLGDQALGMPRFTPLSAGNELGVLQALTDMARRGRLDGYPEDVLRRAGEVFNSPAFDSVRADANAASNLTAEQISRLLEASKDLQRDLERRR